MLLCSASGTQSASGPNCHGCFNATSGTCLNDQGDGSNCSPATASDCAAVGLEFYANEPNTWPTGKGSCLAYENAKCMVDLNACGGKDERYTLHANTTAQCVADAKNMGATHVGFSPVSAVSHLPRSICHASADLGRVGPIHHFKSQIHHFKSQIHHLKYKIHHLKYKIHHFK